MCIEEFMPERFRHQHTKHSDHYFDQPIVSVNGQQKQIITLTKNCQEIPIEVSLSPIVSDKG
jgi:hypothetical protein